MAKKPQKKPAAAGKASQRRRSLAAPTRGDGRAKIFTSKPVPVGFAGPEHRYVRADIEISGVFHGEASYEGRIFLNNPKADAKTPKDLAHGYAGSFHIFGHGGCLGDVGHCEVTERKPGDLRPPHPLTPAKKRVTVTAALREIAKSKKDVTVTVVPVVSAINELCDSENVFRCKEIKFLTYN
jgi:hypothetical protein